MRSIVWFRGKDLRLADHGPLHAAVSAGDVIPLFVLDPVFFAPDRARELPHRMQFLLASLAELAANLARRGSRLVVVPGRSVEVVPRLAREWRADQVLAHGWVEPFGRERDRRVQEALGGRLALHEGTTLLPRGALRSRSGRPYAVFGAFLRAFRETLAIGRALPAPRSLPPLPGDVRERGVEIPTCESLGISLNPRLLPGGEAAARRRLESFLRRGLATYGERRDRMDLPGTSRLSADLKFGTLSVREVWDAVSDAGGAGAAAFLDELVWREFAHAILWDRPEVLRRPFRDAFVGFPWREGGPAWRAWVDGRTGYPIVDAAARQLVGEGFVHNRARMIAASFLTKHLLVDYRRGEAHYMTYLADGDWASNNLGWQWSAGCGCDAQPYFRVFNPILQGARFDPEGAYVRRWLPELARVPSRYVHRPWEAPEPVLRDAGVRLGRSYPRPIVEHRAARARFLALASGHLRGTAARGAIASS